MILLSHKQLFISIFICGLITACSENKVSHTPVYFQDILQVGSQGPKLAIIPKGVGVVGGANFRSFQNQSPQHKVILDHEFAMGVAEVTFEEYDLFCATTKIKCPYDKGWGRGKQPVMNISWLEAVAYTEWLSKQTNESYRLPSEAEWEYAARGGSTTKFWWGDEYIQGMDHCDRDLGSCPAGTEISRPGLAGRFKANPFGLFDVTSNLYEWVLDCDSPNHDGASNTMEARLNGDCSLRISKGSSWLNPQPYVHLSKRMGIETDYKNRSLGFRVLRVLKDKDLQP
jgi:formylglycine-generating enzyme required for sulfatase activity